MGDNFTKDDLYNMFKSYELNIKYNIQLYDRQELLVKEQGKVIDTLANITDKQVEINRQLETLIKTLTEHNFSCNNSIVDATQSIKEVLTSVGSVGDKVTDSHIEGIRDRGVLKIYLIGISLGLTSVFVSLIVALEKIWSKSDIIDAVAKYIGVK